VGFVLFLFVVNFSTQNVEPFQGELTDCRSDLLVP